MQEALKENSHRMLTEHELEEEEFNARLQKRWYPAFDRLRILIVLSEEAERDFNPRESEGLSDEEENIVEALKRIHIRAARCAREVFCLLRSGFSDGAFARWRTLHDLPLSALFIKKHGGNVAQKYMDYRRIETYYEIKKYREHNEELGYEKEESEEEYKVWRKDLKQDIIDRKGKEEG